MDRKGDTTSWMVRYLPILILVLITLGVVLKGAANFDVGGAGVSSLLRGYSDQIDQGCARGVSEKPMTFDFPETVENVEIEGAATYRATVTDGSPVTVEAESCTRVAICAEGGVGADCPTGGRIPSGESAATVYYSGDEAIIDLRE